ncbi:MAG: outer membrane beta-barrel protein [Planctomycetota bacterium]
MKLRSGFLSLHVILILIVGQAAVADDFADGMFTPRSGIYVSGTIGYGWNYEITANDIGGTSDEGSFDMDDHEAYTGAIGVYLGPTRVEFEVGLREPDMLQVNGAPGVTTSGDLEYLTFMGNIYYDIQTPVQGLDIYIGGGAGVAVISGDLTFSPSLTVSGPFVSSTTTNFDDRFSTFAYQFMAGASFSVTDNVTIFGGYRLRLFTESNEDNSLLIFREHEVNGVEVGLRINF